jgi:hypothetical protein
MSVIKICGYELQLFNKSDSQSKPSVYTLTCDNFISYTVELEWHTLKH